jgi:hypothetical protein
MDLEVARQRAGKGWQWAKFAALACFALAGALMVGSLLKPQAARAADGTEMTTMLLTSPALPKH